MPIDFPASPATGDYYSYDQRTWKWNGSGWILVSSGNLVQNIDGGGPDSVYGGISSVDGGGV